MERLSEKELILITKEYGYDGSELDNKYFKENGNIYLGGDLGKTLTKKLNTIFEVVKPLRMRKQDKGIRYYEVDSQKELEDFDVMEMILPKGGNRNKSHCRLSEIYYNILCVNMNIEDVMTISKKDLCTLLFLPKENFSTEDEDVMLYFNYFISKFKYRLYNFTVSFIESPLRILQRRGAIAYSCDNGIYTMKLLKKHRKYNNLTLKKESLSTEVHNIFFDELLKNAKNSKTKTKNQDDFYNKFESEIVEMYLDIYHRNKIKDIKALLEEYGDIFNMIEEEIKNGEKILSPIEEYLKTYHQKNKSKLNEYFVYRFLDKSNNIIYIGKTKYLYQRMYSHFRKGHLPEECYKNVSKIEYVKYQTIGDMDIMELYYICKNKPKYNTKSIHNITIEIDTSMENWESVSDPVLQRYLTTQIS